MRKNSIKVQAYLSEQTANKIKELAESEGVSTSKFASRVLEKYAGSENNEEAFRVKIQAILGQILSSVYDYDISKRNADEVRILLRTIDKNVAAKVLDDN